MINLSDLQRILKRYSFNDSVADKLVTMADTLNTVEASGGTTNLSIEFVDGDLFLRSSSGTDVQIPLADATNPGLISAAQLAKLNSIDATHYGAPLADTTALAALPQAGLTDKERRYIEAQLSDYFYDAQATSGDIAPDDQAAATGFWRQVAMGGETAASLKTKYESNADTNAFTDAEKSKLAAIDAGAEVNVQADWTETDTNSDAFIANKPAIPDSLDDLTGTLANIAGNLDDIADGTNHVRMTPAERTKLTSVQANAEPNVQPDWNVTNDTSDAYIINKPDIPTTLGDLTGTLDDIADGVTNVAFTATNNTKLAGIATGAEANVQADWTETDTNSDAYIANKPAIPDSLDDLTGTLDDIADGASRVALTPAQLAKLNSIDATHYGAPLADTTALAALPQAGLTDKERRYVEAQLSDYFYDVQATSGDVAPDDQAAATGFWRRVAVGGETAAGIKTKYESNANTNAFTDTEKSKLAAIDAGAEVNVQANWTQGNSLNDSFILNKPAIPDSLDDLTGTLDDIADGTTNVAFTPTERTKLAGIETAATADQSAAEIKSAYESLVPAASQAEAQAGTETGLRVFSPLRIAEAIEALATASGGRELLTADRDYYVNASTGSDTNDGLSSGSAFATIQKAIDTTAALDLSIYDVTINLANGTYGAFVLKKCVGAGSVTILGDETTPANVVITTSTNTILIDAQTSSSTTYHLRGLTLQNTTTGQGSTYCVFSRAAFVTFDNMRYGVATYHIRPSDGSSFFAVGSTAEIFADCGAHVWSNQDSIMNYTSSTITLTGTPDFSNTFLRVTRLAIGMFGAVTFVGSGTGVRYRIDTNSVVVVNGASTTFLPGNAAGVSNTGAQYA